MNIGIFGGTFDPIHNGHLIAADETKDVLGLDQILFIPAKIPPHKLHKHITNSANRVEMVREAVAGFPFFDVSEVEINRDGPSYTIDTLDELSSRGTLTLIIGLDSFYELETWRDYERILGKYRVAVVIRPGVPQIELDVLPEAVKACFPDYVADYRQSAGPQTPGMNPDWKICILPIPGLKISASEIRDRVNTGRTIHFLVPPSVQQYIRSHALYRSGKD